MLPAHPRSGLGEGGVVKVVRRPRLVALSSGATSCREHETLDVDTPDKLKFGELKGVPSQEVESVVRRVVMVGD